jgi:hypothetical protein
VPIVGINGHVIGSRQIDRFGELAHALGVSTTADSISQALFVSKLNGDLAFYTQRGVPLVGAKSPDPYWDTLPWKKAGKSPADAIL